MRRGHAVELGRSQEAHGTGIGYRIESSTGRLAGGGQRKWKKLSVRLFFWTRIGKSTDSCMTLRASKPSTCTQRLDERRYNGTCRIPSTSPQRPPVTTSNPFFQQSSHSAIECLFMHSTRDTEVMTRSLHLHFPQIPPLGRGDKRMEQRKETKRTKRKGGFGEYTNE